MQTSFTKNFPKNTQEISALIGPVSNPEALEYLNFHLARYLYLLEIVLKHIPAKTNKILDIGTGFEVELMRDLFKLPIDTMGFYRAGWPVIAGENFYELDLNDPNAFKNIKAKYSLVIMAEVIEHLYTAPEIVLPKIINLIDTGGILIIQTPNAVSFPKRLKMLVGIHPFEKIRLNKFNPGHFREYTLKELTTICQSCGLEIIFSDRKNYFRPKNKLLSFLYSLEFLWPPSLRTGMTLVLRKI